MQNVVWKLVVLVGVIGASCGVVYKAHEGLKQAQAEQTEAGFQPLQTPDGLEELSDAPLAFAAESPLSQGIQPAQGLLLPVGQQEPTAAPEPATTNVEPTLAASRSLFASAMSNVRETEAEPSVGSSLAAPQVTRVSAEVPVGSNNAAFNAFAPQQPEFDSESQTDSPFAPRVPQGDEQSESPLRPHREPILMPTPEPESASVLLPVEATTENAAVASEVSVASPLFAPESPSTSEAPAVQRNLNPFDVPPTAPEPNTAESATGNPFAGLPTPALPASAESESTEPTPVAPPFGLMAPPAVDESQVLPAARDPFAPVAPEATQTTPEPQPAGRNPFERSTIPTESETTPARMILPVQNEEPTPASGSPFLTPPAAPAALSPAPQESTTEDVVPSPFFQRPPVNEDEVVPQPPLMQELTPASPPVLNPSPADPFSPNVPESQPTMIPQRPEPVENSFSTGSPFNAPPETPLVSQPTFPVMGTGTVDANSPRGPQQPELKIEKIAPTEAVVGEPIIYSILVRNVGGSPAHKVVVEDRIPRGVDPTSLGTSPQAFITEDKLFWELGTLNPGDNQKIQIRVTPTDSGDIGSVATVRFAASVAATIRVTAPKLTIEMQGPAEIAVGEQVPYTFKVTNSGDGEGRKVFIRALLPPSLQHPGGNDIEYELGSLPPGESRQVDLTLTAVQAGPSNPKALVTLDGNVKHEQSLDLNIIESRLTLQRTGPQQRFINRPAGYTNVVKNNSSEMLQGVTIVEQIPEGVEWMQQPGNEARWNPANRTVTWTIPQLRPGESMQFISQVQSTTVGDFQGAVTATDARGNQAKLATSLSVRGFANLAVDVRNSGEPAVAVGEQVAMRVFVSNDGSAAARDVQTTFTIPAGLLFVDAKGPVRHREANGIVTFETLSEIPANGQQSFDIILTASEENKDARVRVELQTADFNEPLQREERVQIYREK